MRSILGERLADFALACIVLARCVCSWGGGALKWGEPITTHSHPCIYLRRPKPFGVNLSRAQNSLALTGAPWRRTSFVVTRVLIFPESPTTVHNQRLSCHIHRVGKELPARGPLWREEDKRRDSRGRESCLFQIQSFRTWIDTDIGISDW